MGGAFDEGEGNLLYREARRYPSIFAKELQGVLTVLAQNVKMPLIPTGHVQTTNVYGLKTDQTGKLEASFGNIYYQMVKSIFIEMALHPHHVGTHPVQGLESYPAHC